MARAPFQVLVLPFIIEGDEIKYCIFRRSDMDIWQFISGGGEGEETFLQAAKRESFEEAEINPQSDYYKLDSMCTIPAEIFGEQHMKNWGREYFVVPEYSFGLRIFSRQLKLSHEHREYRWVSCKEARELLRYDSNKTSVYELDRRIKENMLK